MVAFLVCHCRHYRPLCHRCLHSFTIASDIVVIVVVLHRRHFHLPSSSIIHHHCTCHHHHICSPLSSKAAVTAVVVIHSMVPIKSCITACRHLRGWLLLGCVLFLAVYCLVVNIVFNTKAMALSASLPPPKQGGQCADWVQLVAQRDGFERCFYRYFGGEVSAMVWQFGLAGSDKLTMQ